MKMEKKLSKKEYQAFTKGRWRTNKSDLFSEIKTYYGEKDLTEKKFEEYVGMSFKDLEIYNAFVHLGQISYLIQAVKRESDFELGSNLKSIHEKDKKALRILRDELNSIPLDPEAKEETK